VSDKVEKFQYFLYKRAKSWYEKFEISYILLKTRESHFKSVSIYTDSYLQKYNYFIHFERQKQSISINIIHVTISTI
jgi:hypothetical protein